MKCCINYDIDANKNYLETLLQDENQSGFSNKRNNDIQLIDSQEITVFSSINNISGYC